MCSVPVSVWWRAVIAMMDIPRLDDRQEGCYDRGCVAKKVGDLRGAGTVGDISGLPNVGTQGKLDCRSRFFRLELAATVFSLLECSPTLGTDRCLGILPTELQISNPLSYHTAQVANNSVSKWQIA